MVASASAEQDPVDARDLVRLVEQPGLLAHRHQRADVVEQVDEQKDEDDLDEADAAASRAISSLNGGGGQIAPGCRAAASISRRRVSRPTTVVARMPISIAARTRHASSAAISSSPKSASAVLLSRRLPSVTVVAGCGTMIPELRNPMNAMNSPTPAATAA